MKKKLTTRSVARAAGSAAHRPPDYCGHHHWDEIEQYDVGQTQRAARRNQRDSDQD
jgi:hypothetical protein